MSVASQVAPKATDKVRLLGFAEDEADAVDFLLDAAAHSARVTSHQGNRRYGVLFLTIIGGVVRDITLDEYASSWCEQCMNTEIVYDSRGETHACTACSGLDKRSDSVQ